MSDGVAGQPLLLLLIYARELAVSAKRVIKVWRFILGAI